MKRLTLALSIALIIITIIFYKDNKTYLSLPPENHPEVINVEKMIDRATYVEPVTKKKIALAIVSNGKFYDVKYHNLVAIAFVESRFKPSLINDTGDYGLMQVNYGWWGKKFNVSKNELLNVYKNVEVACKIIKFNERNGFAKLSAYHSLDPDRQFNYEQKLKDALRRI